MDFFPRLSGAMDATASASGGGRPSDSIRQALFQRLKRLGIKRSLVPVLIRNLATSQRIDPHINLPQINRRLHYLGWDDLNLDYHTWQLALACMETDACRAALH